MQATKEQAEQAIKEWQENYMAGGELPYPHWADEVLKACEEAERFTERVIARGDGK